MMYEQRAPTPTDQFEPQGPWLPEEFPSLPDPAERERRGPWYVVVDEMIATGCRCTVDLWPDVDADGRLVFQTDRTSLQWVDTQTAWDVIRAARRELADSPEELEIADRELRIGDVFAVWLSAATSMGLEPPGAAAGAASRRADADEPPGGLRDVTGEARVATRAAVDAVGAGELTEADLERLGIPRSAVQETPDSMSAP